MFTDPTLFGLTTASPAQRAICRLIDGTPLGDLIHEPGVAESIGAWENVDGVPVFEITVVSGIRVAKSLFAACLSVLWSQRCDVSRLRPGEVPRVGIVATDKDKAQPVLDHLIGGIRSSERLRALQIGEPTAESIMLRHPTGRPIEICVLAGKRAGGAFIARWAAGAIFDEFPRLLGSDQGVINWDEQRKGVLLRILPGGGVGNLGSPWAPDGPAFDMVRKHHGAPTKALAVVKAPAWVLNPVWWTPDRVAEAIANDPDAAETDVKANFATPEEQLYTNVALERSTRKSPEDLPPTAGNVYRAAMDPAMRGNGWTLGIATREGRKKRIVLVREWVGSRVEPLDPDKVFEDAAEVLAPFGVKEIETDQYSVDALKACAKRVGLRLFESDMTETQKTQAYLDIGARLLLDEIELPPETTDAGKHLRTDLQRVRKRPKPGGGFSIVLPKSADGRHCDMAPMTMLLIGRWCGDAVRDDKPRTAEEANARQAAILKAGALAAVRQQQAERTRMGAPARGRAAGWIR